MAVPRSVWSIDIGQCALKAMKLREIEGELQIDAFDLIEHSKILTQAADAADRKQLIQTALAQFLARNNVTGSLIAVSVPGQSSFTRFVKLPPVEPKKVPEIVRFEAEQQIPFPINEVQWRWQTFQDKDSPDVEVGIFAMKKLDIDAVLDHFKEVELDVDVVQMAPLALYNYMKFDGQTAPDGATLLADVGADKTDLVIADGPRIWTRTIQIGGNSFTEALVKSFKLSFPKAEKLKRSAATSKYARQIFQAMRPIFADLVQEIQRSIGFYTSLHREARFKLLVGLGNGFRLPGLQKFFEQNLNINIVRVDSYLRVKSTDVTSTQAFTENVPSFGVAYGLALQALGLTAIDTNLLPLEIVRKRRWAKKNMWFMAAGGVLTVGMLCNFIGEHKDLSALEKGDASLKEANGIVETLKHYRDENNQFKSSGEAEKKICQENLDLFGYRDLWPSTFSLVYKITDEVTKDRSEQKMLSQISAIPAIDDAAMIKQRNDLISNLTKIPRSKRWIIYTTKIIPTIVPGPKSKSLKLEISGYTPLKSAVDTNELRSLCLRKIPEIFKSDQFKQIFKFNGGEKDLMVTITPVGGAAAGPSAPPPGSPPGPEGGGPPPEGHYEAPGSTVVTPQDKSVGYEPVVDSVVNIVLTVEITGNGLPAVVASQK
ncbi:MAG: type IV pilus assembly protein PilM [Planctomycetes bacterium]|nr:type IV pilus assembly protein PilM [Planctomycetota bacterium]